MSLSLLSSKYSLSFAKMTNCHLQHRRLLAEPMLDLVRWVIPKDGMKQYLGPPKLDLLEGNGTLVSAARQIVGKQILALL